MTSDQVHAKLRMSELFGAAVKGKSIIASPAMNDMSYSGCRQMIGRIARQTVGNSG